MYIIRETFIAKPGHAGELAQLMKDEMGQWQGFDGYVLLDMVTDYNTIVIEYKVKSLADFEAMMSDHKKEQSKTKKKNKAPKYTELYLTGKREIFRIV